MEYPQLDFCHSTSYHHSRNPEISRRPKSIPNNDEDAGKAILRLEEQADPGCKMILLEGDCGDSDTVRAQYQKVREKLGPPNVLVNNAGIMLWRSFEEISFEDWDQTFRINLSGSFYRLYLSELEIFI